MFCKQDATYFTCVKTVSLQRGLRQHVNLRGQSFITCSQKQLRMCVESTACFTVGQLRKVTRLWIQNPNCGLQAGYAVSRRLSTASTSGPVWRPNIVIYHSSFFYTKKCSVDCSPISTVNLFLKTQTNIGATVQYTSKE